MGKMLNYRALITLVLIVCTTFLAYERILSTDAWVALITMIGGIWGLTGTDTGKSILKKAAASPPEDPPQ